MIRTLKGHEKVTVRNDDIIVEITNSGQDEDFTADCLPSMKKKKDKVCSIWIPLTPRVVSANDQKERKRTSDRTSLDVQILQMNE